MIRPGLDLNYLKLRKQLLAKQAKQLPSAIEQKRIEAAKNKVVEKLKPCKCKDISYGYTGYSESKPKKNWPKDVRPLELHFYCKQHGQPPVVVVPKKDRVFWHRSQSIQNQSIKQLNEVWFKFREKFCTEHDDFKYRGYEFMDLVDEFAKTNPIIVTGCDDGGHTSSSIVLIPHENPNEYWGTTVIIIPQNFGPTTEFFLYDNHTEELNKALTFISHLHETKNRYGY